MSAPSRILFPLLLIAPWLFACTSEEPPSEPPNIVLMKTDQEFSGNVAVSGFAAALQEYLSDDAVLLPDDGFPLMGKDPILEEARRMQNTSMTRTPLKAEVSTGGDLGYTWGSCQISTTYPNGVTTAQPTKYVTVWRKNADGQWRIVAEISNQTPMSVGT